MGAVAFVAGASTGPEGEADAVAEDRADATAAAVGGAAADAGSSDLGLLSSVFHSHKGGGGPCGLGFGNLLTE